MTDGIIGTKYGRRTVISKAHKKSKGQWYLFRCDCGHEKILDLRQVRNGKSQRCMDCAMRDAHRDRINRKLFWNDLVEERIDIKPNGTES